MIHQLFIKLFILLAVLDVAVAGVLLEADWLLYLSLINLTMMIVVLFQHRSALQDMTPEGKRTLFTPSVFFLISIWVGLLSWYFMDQQLWELLQLSKLWGSLGIGLFTYVSSYVLFRMGTQQHGWNTVSALLFGLLLLGSIARLGKLLGMVYSTGVIGEWLDQLATNRAVEQVALVNNDTMDENKDAVDVGQDDNQNDDIVETDTDSIEISGEEGDGSVQDTDNDETLPDTTDVGKEMSYADLIPWVVERYNLQEGIGARFDLISPSNVLYQSFDAARAEGMVGTNINPEWLVRCQNLMVIVGIAEGWEVSTSLPTLDRYWQAGTERGLTGICGEKTEVANTVFFNSIDNAI